MVVHALMADHPCMEPLHIAVKEIHRDRRKGLLVARTQTASREQITGVHLAVVHVTVHLQNSAPAMNQCELSRKPRDEALRHFVLS